CSQNATGRGSALHGGLRAPSRCFAEPDRLKSTWDSAHRWMKEGAQVSWFVSSVVPSPVDAVTMERFNGTPTPSLVHLTAFISDNGSGEPWRRIQSRVLAAARAPQAATPLCRTRTASPKSEAALWKTDGRQGCRYKLKEKQAQRSR